MITEQRARELRSVIETAMTSVSDEVALSAPELSSEAYLKRRKLVE